MSSNSTEDVMHIFIEKYDATVTLLADDLFESIIRHVNHDLNDSERRLYDGILKHEQKNVKIPEMDIVRAYFRQVHSISGTDRHIDDLILELNQRNMIHDLTEGEKKEFFINSGDLNKGIIYKFRKST